MGRAVGGVRRDTGDMAPTIRSARPADAAALAELTGQLGYPTDASTLVDRLAGLLQDDTSTLLVAVGEDDRPIGWLHLEVHRTLTSPASVLIAGFVVDEAHRSGGVGKTLLHAGEAWARERGVARMTLYSRQTRERAHAFYEREGYVVVKRSFFFEKPLE